MRGKPYIEFLGNLDDGTVMKTLMEYLQSVPAKANNSSVLPQKWIESKIARIRKLAIETAQSLAIEENVNVTTMLSADGEQLIVKRTNLRTKDVYRTNHYITKAVNPHRVLAKHPYQSYTKETYLEGASGQALKDGLVTMDSLRGLATRARSQGSSITTIGVSLGYNEETLAALALESNGRHHFVKDETDLAAVFEKEAEILTGTVASGAEALVTLAPGVELSRVVDRSFDVQGNLVRVPLGSLGRGEVKTVLLAVRSAAA